MLYPARVSVPFAATLLRRLLCADNIGNAFATFTSCPIFPRLSIPLVPFTRIPFRLRSPHIRLFLPCVLCPFFTLATNACVLRTIVEKCIFLLSTHTRFHDRLQCLSDFDPMPLQLLLAAGAFPFVVCKICDGFVARRPIVSPVIDLHSTIFACIVAFASTTDCADFAILYSPDPPQRCAVCRRFQRIGFTIIFSCFVRQFVHLFYLTRLVKRLDLLDFQYTISAPDAQVTIVRLLFPFFAHLRSQRRDFSLSCRLRRLIDRRLHNVIRFFSYQRALFVSCIPDRK